MRLSLQKQLIILVITPLLLLGSSIAIAVGLHTKENGETAAIEKAQSDLNTFEALMEYKYPGPWREENGILYKGDVQISYNYEPVDYFAKLTENTVTIFLRDTRVSTTVLKKNGDRAIGTIVSEPVANTVLRNGQIYLGEANVVGTNYQTAYKPIIDNDGKIIGIIYVGVSKALTDRIISHSLVTIAIISILLTIGVGIGAWIGTQRLIVGPLQQITSGTKNIVTKGYFNKVDIKSKNEIGDLAKAFNQMIDGLQKLNEQINNTNKTNIINNTINANNENNPGQGAVMEQLAENNQISVSVDDEDKKVFEDIDMDNATEENSTVNLRKNNFEYNFAGELPKSINEQTLKQILAYLDTQEVGMSAEEIGERVSLTRVTVRRYLEYLEQCGLVKNELKYGTVGRPVKLYKKKEKKTQ